MNKGIGLGMMGNPIVRNVIKAGFTLNVYDLNPIPVNELINLDAGDVLDIALNLSTL